MFKLLWKFIVAKKKYIAVVGITIIVVAGLFGSGYFCGWKIRDADYRGLDNNTEVRDKTDESINKLSEQIQSINSAVGDITGAASRIEESVGNGFDGIESSVEGLSDLITNSEKVGDITGSLGGDIADIGTTSRKLAEAIGLSTTEE